MFKLSRKEDIVKLKVTTDYAIRTLLYMAKKRTGKFYRNNREIINSEKLYTRDSVGLRNEKLVNAQASVEVGYMIASISVFQVLSLMGSKIKMNCYLEPDYYCSHRVGNGNTNRIHKIFSKAV